MRYYGEAMERRLAAIVAADVANYSILIGQNEQGTLQELDRLQEEIFTPAIRQYHGRIVRLMGDGSLLAFDSALNAVKFAVDVQRSMATRQSCLHSDIPIKFRMGANLGDIIHQRDDIHGEGINVAVRLEELAPPGGICVSDSLYAQTRNALGEELMPIGERHLKHIADPILVWRWQPPGSEKGIAAPANPSPRNRHHHGRQILDPKVTSLLLDLHMRSAKLALSDAFDDMLLGPDGGRRLSLPEIHRMIAGKLAAAGDLLFPISVERAPAAAPARVQRQSCVAMGDFLNGVLDGGDMFFALSMLRRIQGILRSRAGKAHKRAAFMRMTGKILHEANLQQVKETIRFAFVDA
jgi:class 3 adenylate cyclase